MKRKLSSMSPRVLRGGLATVLAVVLVPGTPLSAISSASKVNPTTTHEQGGSAERAPLGAANVLEGRAWVNQAPLVSGATIYVGDRVHVGEKAAASLQLPSGQVLAGAGSELFLRPSGVRLEKGIIQVRQTAGAALGIETETFRVQLEAADGKAAAAEVNVGKGEGGVVVVLGTAEVVAEGDSRTYRVKSGDGAVIRWDGPDAARVPRSPVGQTAGEVSRLVPAVRIVRGTNEWTAAVQSAVEWNDELRSSRGGRARVLLLDGSTLNLGSDSTLRVQQHDPGTQQTQLELSLGRLRSRVVRQARPGARFEVRTPVASAGVVGTDFYLFSDASGTILIVFDGEVRLTSLLTGQMLLATSGQKIVVGRDGSMSGPTQAMAEEIEQAQSSTDVSEEEARRQAPPTSRRRRAAVVIMVSGVVAGTILGLWLTHREPSSPVTLSGPPN